tara:strand:+ start:387 stop:641 length:255 start_codon:yes stop_codon:yes gene_type:complete
LYNIIHGIICHIALDTIPIIIETSQSKGIMIQLGMEVNHKIHDDLNGSEVILLDRVTNRAVLKNWINETEFQTVDVFLSDLEVA